MNCRQAGNPSLWGYALSALIGSAITLTVIELRRKLSPSSSSPKCCNCNCNCDYLSKSTQTQTVASSSINGNAGEKVDKEVGNCNEIATKDEGPRSTDEITTVSENGGLPCLPSYQPSRFRRRESQRPSFSGSFNEVDGDRRHSFQSLTNSIHSSVDDDGPRYCSDTSTSVTVLSEQNWLSDDTAVMQAQEFDNLVVSRLKTLEESQLLLHRTRTVSALASSLMAAPDEESCFEVASNLLVPLFQVDRCSYALLKDEDHIIVKGVTVKKRQLAKKLGLDAKDGGVVRPLRKTIVGKCAETMKQQYCPRTKDSKIEQQRVMHSVGINSILATPIIVNGDKFTGAIIVSMTKEDAFKEYDKILIQDIASMLGANVYAKRMRRAAERANKISREMLHSMIPSKVIEKIQVFWDENSDEYQSRRSIDMGSTTRDSTCDSSIGSPDEEDSADELDNSLKLKRGKGNPRLRRSRDVRDKINFLNQMNTGSDDSEGDNNTGIILDTSEMEIGSLSRALYAENVKDVVIIFTDIVGFSKMSLDMKPLEVVDMLQSLFIRFDALCTKHGVNKLETIGDAYICTTNLFDEDEFGGNVKDAAINALNMAKDMILATKDVMMPRGFCERKGTLFESIEIRVGVHVGEVTCGVLGERLPKFTVFGHNVNMAARMEQASKPSMIRASEDFKLLVDDVEDGWEEREIVEMKNMGDVGTYLLDPMKCQDDDSSSGFQFYKSEA